MINPETVLQKINSYNPGITIRLFLVGLFFGVVFLLSHYIKKDTLYDFDQVMYAACVYHGFESNAEKVRDLTYAAVLADLGPKKFAQFTDNNNFYRREVYKSPDNLIAQLPFYKIKFVHVGLLRLGYAAGYSPFKFSTYINLVCFVLMSSFILLFLIRRLGFLKGWLAATLLIMMPAICGTAKLNSPDLLTCLVFTLSVFAFISPPFYRNLSIVLFALLIFVRPENVFLPVILCVLGLFFRSTSLSPKFLLLLGATTILSYVILNILVKPYPWWLLYRHSFQGYIPDPQNTQPGFTFMEYLISLKLVFRTTTYSDFFVTVFLLCFTIISAANNNQTILQVALAVLLSLTARALLFPDLSSRFYAGPFVVSAIFLLLVIFPKNITKDSIQ